ncbi:unnamed protein product [Pedinophyceae sp. YPF-701]|nr:unnamed protein product [Pedinophyceae sp. YPF-701]
MEGQMPMIGGEIPPPPPPQLPEIPAPGLAIAEELDQRLLVQLRDGRKLLGHLRSFDQFANVVLEDAIERVVVGRLYGDIHLGVQVVRGENVVLMGRVEEGAAEMPAGYERVNEAEIKEAQKAEKVEQELRGGMAGRFDFLDE